MHKYISHTNEDIEYMLKEIGVSSLEELFVDLPESVRLQEPLKIDASKSELEVVSHLKSLGQKNKSDVTIFRGMGAYDHYIPSIIKHIISRSEFYTSYTPYQPEVSQGTLQYIFEYQTMICDLTGMYVSNASLYDGPTATAEAMFMVTSQTKQDRILVSKTVNPSILKVVETYAHFRSIEVIYVESKDGVTDLEDLHSKITSKCSNIIVQNPNVFGIVEDYSTIVDLVHQHKGLVVMNVNPTSLALIQTPGEIGADIACGEAQTLGLALNNGGPYLGFLATTEKLLRKMPGRICGQTKDIDGKRAFVLTLQAREQHIRREKATSNICSNQSLNALVATIYLSTMGKKGLTEVAQTSMNNAHYLMNELTKNKHYELVYNQVFFNEFVVKTNKDVDALNNYLLEHGILGGYHLGLIDERMKGHLLMCTTEKRTKEEMDLLVSLMEAF